MSSGVKVYYNTEIKRFLVSNSFKEFVLKMKELFQIDISQRKFKISYLDEDNDWVSFSSQEEWGEALKHKKEETLKIRVEDEQTVVMNERIEKKIEKKSEKWKKKLEKKEQKWEKKEKKREKRMEKKELKWKKKMWKNLQKNARAAKHDSELFEKGKVPVNPVSKFEEDWEKNLFSNMRTGAKYSRRLDIPEGKIGVFRKIGRAKKQISKLIDQLSLQKGVRDEKIQGNMLKEINLRNKLPNAVGKDKARIEEKVHFVKEKYNRIQSNYERKVLDFQKKIMMKKKFLLVLQAELDSGSDKKEKEKEVIVSPIQPSETKNEAIPVYVDSYPISPVEDNLQKKCELLRNMGFVDDEKNKKLIVEKGGDLPKVLYILLNEGKDMK